jgi:hypothetical protein
MGMGGVRGPPMPTGKESMNLEANPWSFKIDSIEKEESLYQG